MSWISLEIGIAVLVVWVLLLPVLWKTIEREGHPGIFRGNMVVEHILLAHLLMLVLGISFVIRGSGLFD